MDLTGFIISVGFLLLVAGFGIWANYHREDNKGEKSKHA